MFTPTINSEVFYRLGSEILANILAFKKMANSSISFWNIILETSRQIFSAIIQFMSFFPHRLFQIGIEISLESLIVKEWNPNYNMKLGRFVSIKISIYYYFI